MKEKLIGREKESKELREWINSERSEFIAIYGRRRVGKTFLVKKTIGDKICFYFSGSYKLNRKSQLLNFGLALRDRTGNQELEIPDNWIEAFNELKHYLEKLPEGNKVVFIDELPWIDTPKSGFIPALENFWNSWASWRDDIKLIVCGSATSWIISKIIKNKGGLHNRITHSMLVNPFDLKECEEYFKAYRFGYSRMQIAECYMTLGGIPYYFSLMKSGESLSKNIDYLFFSADAPLKNEFEDLYRALFQNAEKYITVIKALSEKGIGLTRQEILKKTRLTNNGEFSKILEDLELCGFIRSYLPFQDHFTTKKKNIKVNSETLFQLVDFYTLFYLRFQNNFKLHNEHFWSGMINSPAIYAWRGITFEMLCLWHVKQIKRALGIGDVSTQEYSWTGESDGKKVQIDLLIVREDNTINLCEIKFSLREFSIDKEYADNLLEKTDVFIESTHTNKTVLLTMITTKGIKKNNYSYIVQREVKLDSLFE